MHDIRISCLQTLHTCHGVLANSMTGTGAMAEWVRMDIEERRSLCWAAIV